MLLVQKEHGGALLTRGKGFINTETSWPLHLHSRMSHLFSPANNLARHLCVFSLQSFFPARLNEGADRMQARHGLIRADRTTTLSHVDGRVGTATKSSLSTVSDRRRNYHSIER